MSIVKKQQVRSFSSLMNMTIIKVQPNLTPHQIAKLICEKILIHFRSRGKNSLKFSELFDSINGKNNLVFIFL
jgi:hypothetical protein